MAKIRLHIPPQEINDSITLDKQKPLHKLKNVLRLKENQKIYIFDGNGKEWEYEIEKIKQKKMIVNKIKKNKEVPAANQKLCLGFPLIQAKKVDLILQKATELGITEFIPFVSSRSLRSKINDKKIEHWRKIIIEACRQSERLWLPIINYPIKLKELTERCFDLKLIALPNENDKITTLKNKPEKIICIVGPEGGFSSKELNDFKEYKFNTINLSENILRTETAAIFLSGLIQYLVK